MGISLRTMTFVVVAAALLQPAVGSADKGAKGRSFSNTALEESLGGVRWGWSPKQVFRHHANEIKAFYKKRIAKAKDAMEEDQLRAKMGREVARIKDSYFEFDGTPSAYDSGFLKGEFTHHNDEALLRIRGPKSDDYYLFIRKRLWKRYRAFQASVFEGASFEEFGDALKGRYGSASVKEGAPVPGAAKTRWYAWKERRVHARAVDNTEFYGFYCLVLEDPKTAKKLGKLRTHKVAKAKSEKSVVDLVEGDDKDINADIADRITGEIRRKPVKE